MWCIKCVGVTEETNIILYEYAYQLMDYQEIKLKLIILIARNMSN